MAFGARLERIYEEMRLLLARCKPQAMSLERLYFYSNKTTAIGVAQARGVISAGGAEGGGAGV